MTTINTAPIRVYLDMAEDENRTDELGLAAVMLGKPWNGCAVPITTAAEFKRFIAAWEANDPNGSWRAEGVTEFGGKLIFDDAEHDEPEEWDTVGTDAAGNALYSLDGWVWAL